MPSYFTRTGDDGFTGLLGEGRVPKYDLRPEVLGSIDEAAAAIGLARSFMQAAERIELMVKIQRDLYSLMAESAATKETASTFHFITPEKVTWLETETNRVSQGVQMPKEFIVAGDTQAGAAIDLARTIVRRAERRMAELLQRGDVSNPELLRFLNRLSSLLFVIELQEIQDSGKARPTLAKKGES
jgi:cob(I)alamin adenosyltransferase